MEKWFKKLIKLKRDSKESSEGVDDASTCALAKKDREERMRLIREKQQQEQERKEAALKGAEEKEKRRMENMERDRLERIRKIKEREEIRQKAVHDKRRQMEEAENVKKQAMVAKYRAQSENRMAQRDRNKPVYAFGSSTPRVLAYLQNLPGDQRVYDKKLMSEPLTKEELEELTKHTAMMNGSFGASHSRATSAMGFPRTSRGLTGNESIEGTPSRSIRNKSNSVSNPNSDLMSASVHGTPQRGRSTVRTSPRNKHLAGASASKTDVMTESFTAGDSGGRPTANPRRKAPTPRRPPRSPAVKTEPNATAANSSQTANGVGAGSRQKTGPPNTAQTRRTPAALAQRNAARKIVPASIPEDRELMEWESEGKESTKSPSSAAANQRRSNQTATPAAANQKRRPASSSVPPTSGRRSKTPPTSASAGKEEKPKPVPRRNMPPKSKTPAATKDDKRESAKATEPNETPSQMSMSPSPPGTPPDQKRLKSETPENLPTESTPGESQGPQDSPVSMESGTSEQRMDLDFRRDSDSSAEQMLVVESTEILRETMDVHIDRTEAPKPQVNNLLIDFGGSPDTTPRGAEPVPELALEPIPTVVIQTPSPNTGHLDEQPIFDQQIPGSPLDLKFEDDFNPSLASGAQAEDVSAFEPAPEAVQVPGPEENEGPVREETGGVEEEEEKQKGAGDSLAEQMSVAVEKERVVTEQNEQAAKAALMEQRRIAREQKEREMERQRLIEEEERRKEEERIRLEEEEFRRQEQEELRVLEEMKRAEEERLQRFMEEEEKRKEEERRVQEEEDQKRREEEERQRLDRERLEKEMKEKDEKFRKEQEEREERKKKLSAIMARTRNSPASTSGVSPNPVQSTTAVSPGSVEPRAPSPLGRSESPARGVNGASGAPAGTPLLSVSSASVLQKLAGSSPALGNILSRHRSNPSLADPSLTSTPKSSKTVINGENTSAGVPRMAMSMMEHGSSIDNSDVAGDSMSTRTLYDVEPTESESMSRSAILFSNTSGSTVDANANSLFDELIESSGAGHSKDPHVVTPQATMDALGEDFWAVPTSLSAESMGNSESSSPKTAIWNGASQGSSLFGSSNELIDFGGSEGSQESVGTGHLTNGHLSTTANAH